MERLRRWEWMPQRRAKLLFGYHAQFFRARLRQRASLEDRGVIAAAARTDEEHHVLAALHLRLNPLEVGFAADGLLVDFENHVTALKSGVVAEAIGFHVLHDDPPGVGELVAVGHVRSNAPNGDAELALLRLGLLTTLLLLAETAGEKFGAVGDGHFRGQVFAAADVAQLGVSSRLQRGNLSHQLVAGLHLLAVHGDDGVAGLQAGFVGGTAGSNTGDGHAAGDSVDPATAGLGTALNSTPMEPRATLWSGP